MCAASNHSDGPGQRGGASRPRPVAAQEEELAAQAWLRRSTASSEVNLRGSKQKIVQVLWVCNRETWLKKLITDKFLCFVLLAADFMGTLVQMACVQCAIKASSKIE